MGNAKRIVAVIDCETDPFGIVDKLGRPMVPQPFVWGFYDGERFRHFATFEELLRFLEPQRLLIYAHNGGKFDYHYILKHLEAYSEVTIINGRLARFMIGNCEFRDSYNILPIPLSAYKKDEIDYAKMLPDVRERHMPEILRYLRSDCVYLWELVSRFRAEYGQGLTLAGSALQYWKSLVGEDPPESSGDFYHAIAPYYYGGRVECFARGVVEMPFDVVDINSAYPFAMLHDHIFCNSFMEKDARRNDPIRQESLYRCDAVSSGALPFRDGNTLSFPDDGIEREYTVTGWELAAALATKTATVTSRMVRRLDFGKTINFQTYINHFYTIKQKAAKESAEYLFAKLFMNSLYGKFGANPENYSNFGIVPRDMANHFTDHRLAEKAMDEHDQALDIGRHKVPWHDGADGDPKGFYWNSAGLLGPWALLESPLSEPEKRYYCLATAASITGFVRAYLWRHICAIREKGGQALYCDTDSIAYTLPDGAAAPFALSKTLGEWSHEGRFRRGAIAGKKLYAFEYAEPTKGKTHKIASKGVRLSAPDIFRVAAGEAVQATNAAPTFSVHKPPSFTSRRIVATAGR